MLQTSSIATEISNFNQVEPDQVSTNQKLGGNYLWRINTQYLITLKF